MPIKRSAAAAALLVISLCAAVIAIGDPPRGDADSCSVGTVSRLYLGQNTPHGTVTETEWRAFVAEAISGRISEGFTEFAAHGHWRDVDGRLLEEQTRIVEIAHDDSRLVRNHIRSIATDYGRRFAQQSVLVTQSRSVLCFERTSGSE